MNKRRQTYLASGVRNVLIAVVLTVVLVAGLGPKADAHQACRPCVQVCVTSQQNGCEVWYPNTGVYRKVNCDGGETTCSMTYTTTCWVMKKVCSYSLCVNNDCESSVCTTYPISEVNASTTYSGASSCN